MLLGGRTRRREGPVGQLFDAYPPHLSGICRGGGAPYKYRCYIYNAEQAIPGLRSHRGVFSFFTVLHTQRPLLIIAPRFFKALIRLSICLHLVGSQKIALDNPWFWGSHVFTSRSQIHLSRFHRPHIHIFVQIFNFQLIFGDKNDKNTSCIAAGVIPLPST